MQGREKEKVVGGKAMVTMEGQWRVERGESENRGRRGRERGEGRMEGKRFIPSGI